MLWYCLSYLEYVSIIRCSLTVSQFLFQHYLVMFHAHRLYFYTTSAPTLDFRFEFIDDLSRLCSFLLAKLWFHVLIIYLLYVCFTVLIDIDFSQRLIISLNLQHPTWRRSIDEQIPIERTQALLHSVLNFSCQVTTSNYLTHLCQ